MGEALRPGPDEDCTYDEIDHAINDLQLWPEPDHQVFLEPDSDDDGGCTSPTESKNGEISRPHDYKPVAQLFEELPIFVPAGMKKNKPICGGSVPGYVFATRSCGTGYYRDDEEARNATNIEETDHRKGTVELPIPVPQRMTDSPSDLPDDQNDEEAEHDLPPQWIPDGSRTRRRNRKRRSAKKKADQDNPPVGDFCCTTTNDE